MDSLERDNLRQIEALNQRGGRTLSVVDLIDANTLDVDIAAYMLCCVANGASFLTAANPGGAGKSTVLAALLNFLPPGTRIITTSSQDVIDDQLAKPCGEPTCVLAHEIGSGHWFGYIWGKDVRRFFQLIGGPRRIASCQHADTLEEMSSILLAPPMSLSNDEFTKLDLAVFIHVDRGLRGVRRRVAAVHEATDEGHVRVYQWQTKADRFERLAESRLLPRLAAGQGKRADALHAELDSAADLIRRLVSEDVRMLGDVRERVLEYYQDAP